MDSRLLELLKGPRCPTQKECSRRRRRAFTQIPWIPEYNPNAWQLYQDKLQYVCSIMRPDSRLSLSLDVISTSIIWPNTFPVNDQSTSARSLSSILSFITFWRTSQIPKRFRLPTTRRSTHFEIQSSRSYFSFPLNDRRGSSTKSIRLSDQRYITPCNWRPQEI